MGQAAQKIESSTDIQYSLDLVKIAKAFERKTLGSGGYSTMKSFFLSLFRRQEKKSQAVTLALKELTMRIPSGASVGVIGRNGSGKSTLLKIISGIYTPDSGSVDVHGRVAALIELGAGFHPDFTGRENVFLGGIMHGLTRAEIQSRFDDIVAFAELKDVIDDPVRTYSSGMFMRLGFSLAVHTEPDILLVDEVLAVGDAAFVAKCKDRISEMRAGGTTLLLVTHDLPSVERWCDEVIWLHEGEVMDRGEPRRVIDHYREFLEKGEDEQLQLNESRSTPEDDQSDEGQQASDGDELTQERWGSREIEIQHVRIVGEEDENKRVFHPEDKLTLELDYIVRTEQEDVVFGVGVNRVDGLVIHGTNTDLEKVSLQDPVPNKGTLRYTISRLGLNEGRYSVDVAVHKSDGYPYDYIKAALDFVVRNRFAQVGVSAFESTWELTGREHAG